MTTNCPLCKKADEYRAAAAAQVQPVCDIAKAACGKLLDRISDYLTNSVSETCIFKVMLISFGLLIGSACSNFFKKHRNILFVACIASVVLFFYKVYQLMSEWDEETETF